MHMHHDPGSRDHEDDGLAFEAMDAPNQSLADALRVSFRILKVVLIIVIVLYFGSGMQQLEQNERALVLRLEATVRALQERTTIILDSPTAPFNLFDFIPDARADANDGSGAPLAHVP